MAKGNDFSWIIWLGAVGAAAWYAYEQGWLSCLLGTSTPSGWPPCKTGTTTSASSPNAAGGSDPLAGCLTMTLPTGDTVTVAQRLAAAMQVAEASTSPTKTSCVSHIADLITQNQITSANMSLPPTTQTSPTAPGPLATTLSAMAGNAPTLTMDQWSYYYQQISGKPTISPDQFGQILAAIGVQHDTQVSATSFVTALHAVGLSGVSWLEGPSFGMPYWAIHGGY